MNKVGSDLITSRRVIFTPNVEIKDELAKTSINITCYDRNGDVVKRVTSSDDGTVEDPENGEENGNGTTDNGNDNQGTVNPEPGTENGGGDNNGGGGGGDGADEN